MGANASKEKPPKAEKEAHECPIHHRCYRRRKAYIEPSPPPVYEKAPATDHHTVWAPGECTCGPYSRVASMPFARPLEGYEYLSVTDRCPPPARACSCDSCEVTIVPSPRVRRHVTHGWHTSEAMHKRNLVTKTINFSFYDKLGHKHPARVVYGLAPGDVERPVEVNWTSTDRWNRPPRWCSALTIVHEGREKLAGADPWDYMTSEGTEMAGLDHRTGRGLFKRVMWYHRDVGYGNDLEKRAPVPWDDESMEAFSSFIRPIAGF